MTGNPYSPAIALEDVVKHFGDQPVLNGVNLVVPQGVVYGISGHNGAGKSMLLRIISGLVRPTAGQVRVFGAAIGSDVEFPPMTGVMIDRPGFLPQYSGLRNLQLLAMIRNQISQGEIAAVMQRVGLDPTDRRPVRTYSMGMRQRLGLAQAIMECLRLLLLDEPTNAIDPDGRQSIYALLRELRAEGITILLTSHSAEELNALCDRVFVMRNGALAPA